MKDILRRAYWLLSMQAGFDPRKLLFSLRGLPRYISDWQQFRKTYSGKLTLFPCLHDRYEEGGAANTEYFWQDLYVAQKIHQANPERHVDIGSRLDGFVAHVASFRPLEVFDIRPITPIISNVTFRQADLMNPTVALSDYCDSVSCLHALEHFGLGRYGDPIDPEGYLAGLRNMAALLKPGGTFYLSVPVGQARVEFNAHRIFDPIKLAESAAKLGLSLSQLAYVLPREMLRESSDPKADLVRLAEQRYALGIFTFIKN